MRARARWLSLELFVLDLDGGTRAAAALSARERLDELEPRAHLLQPAHLDLELRRTQRRREVAPEVPATGPGMGDADGPGERPALLRTLGIRVCETHTGRGA